MERRGLSIEDFARLTHPADPQISPDGSKVAFVVVRPSLSENRYINEVWIVDSESGSVLATLSGEGDSAPRWSPDSRSIVFVSRRGFKEGEKGGALYIYPMGGEPRRVLARKEGVSVAQWVSSGLLGFLSPVPLRKVDENGDYVDVRDLPPWFDGRGFIDEYREQLFIADPASGLYRQVTRGDARVSFWAPSWDGTRIAYISRPDWRRPYITEVRVLDISSGKEITVVRAGRYSFTSLSWSPDGKRLALHGDDRRRGLASHSHVWVVPVEEDAQPVNMTEKLDRNTAPAVSTDALGPYRAPGVPTWIADNTILFLVNDGGRVGFYRLYPDSGEIEPLLRGEYVIYSFTVDRRARRAALLKLSHTELPEIWLYDLGSGGLRRLTRLNAWLEQEIEVSKPVNMRIRASDGAEVEGWYIPPLRKGKGKHPVVLFVHGGPKASYGAAFSFMHQLMAANGFYVVYCNPRGSDGYSEEFADIRGRYGERDFKDIMEFLEEFLRRVPDADPERLGVTGISYGGFMTDWIITHTDRFRAAVSENGIADWVADFWASDIGYWFDPDQIGGVPWRNLESYIRQSPVFYVENVKTPVMFIHSMEDYRCFLDQSLAMHIALRYLGKESRLVVFKSGSHGHSVLAKPRHRRKRYELILEFFKEKLGVKEGKK